jgi:hypothetical protein
MKFLLAYVCNILVSGSFSRRKWNKFLLPVEMIHYLVDHTSVGSIHTILLPHFYLIDLLKLHLEQLQGVRTVILKIRIYPYL